MMIPMLICEQGGCTDPEDSNFDRNAFLKESKVKVGSNWRDEAWVHTPNCRICGRRRNREEMALYA